MLLGGSFANLCAPRRCWNAPIANCAASSDKPAVLVVAGGRKWPSIYRCNGCMPAGPSRLGHKQLARSPWLFILYNPACTAKGTLVQNRNSSAELTQLYIDNQPSRREAARD